MHAEDMLDNSRFVAVIFILGRFIYKNIQKNCTFGTSQATVQRGQNP